MSADLSDMSAHDQHLLIYDRFLDGEISANDERLASLPKQLREKIEQIVASEAAHNCKQFAEVEHRRKRVLSEARRVYDGRVDIVYGEQPRALVINGLGMTSVTDWFYANLFETELAATAWLSFEVTTLSFGFAEDVELVRCCQDAVVSGAYQAVVICDLSQRDLMDPAEGSPGLFQTLLGSHLQAFARGRVAFPTSDGLLLSNMAVLDALFGVTWQACAYVAEPWGPLPQAGGSTLAKVFTAPATTPVVRTKASTLANVPLEERVCGRVLTHDCEIGPDGDFETVEDFEASAAHDGFSVACHAYGEGSVAYFGDTSCSEHNPPVVAAFCRSGFDANARMLTQRRELGIGLATKLRSEAALAAAAAVGVAAAAVTAAGINALYNH